MLPDKSGMMTSLMADWSKHEEEEKARRHFHKMGNTQWDYNRELARIAREPEIPARVEKLYIDVWRRRATNLMDYKKDAYHLEGDEYLRVQR